MFQASALLKRTFSGAQTMATANTADEAWKYRNLIEVVRLAAIQLHAESGTAGTFTWKALVRMARRFHKNRSLPDALVAEVLKEACVEADLDSGLLRFAPSTRRMAAAE